MTTGDSRQLQGRQGTAGDGGGRRGTAGDGGGRQGTAGDGRGMAGDYRGLLVTMGYYVRILSSEFPRTNC